MIEQEASQQDEAVPRGRTASRIDAARARILECAARQFARLGHDGVSLQQVADAAGVSKPTLLYHFESKDRLFEAAFDAERTRYEQYLACALAAEGGSDVSMDALVHAVIDATLAHPLAVQMGIVEAAAGSSRVGHIVERATGRDTRQLEEAIVRWIARGELRPISRPLFQHLVFGTLVAANTLNALYDFGMESFPPPNRAGALHKVAREVLDLLRPPKAG